MATMDFPTVADHLYRETYRYKSLDKVRASVTAARKFVLDKEMSAFMADLAWAAVKAKPDKAPEIVDNMRHLARLPYPLTWIEWDEIALATRARTEYGSDMSPTEVPKRSGFLLRQHPGIPTAIQCYGIGVGTTNFGAEGKMSFGITPFCMNWKTDDDPLPWRMHSAVEVPSWRSNLSANLTGIGRYQCPAIGVSENPDLNQGVSNADIRQMLNEQAGMLRYLFALLSTINDLPVSKSSITTSKGFFAKGKYRKFLDHTMVRLMVPATRFRALARRAVTITQRRGGPVRGHWRNDWLFPGRPFCEHTWKTQGEGKQHVVCEHCGRRRLWIKDHERGDTSQGYVLRDYAVVRGGEDAAKTEHQ